MSGTLSLPGIGRLEPKTPAAQREEARDVAQQLENVFGQLLVQNLRQSAATAPGEGLFGDGPGSDQFSQWFDSLLGERVSHGRGLGIADNLLTTWEAQGLIPREPEPAGAQHHGGTDVRV